MAIATATQFIAIVQIYASAVLSALIWDWLTSLYREVVVIWRAEWNVLKGLYFVCRYYGLGAFAFTLYAYCGTISTERCKMMVAWVPGVVIPLTISTELILGMRCYAIWGRKRWILVMLAVLLVAESGVMILAAVTVRSALPPGVPGPCLPASNSGTGRNLQSAFFFAPVVVDLLLTALTFYKAFTIQMLSGESQILRLFIRDGLVFFFVVTGVNALSAAFYSQNNVGLQAVNAGASLMISSMMCCHLVLGLREEGVRSKLVGAGGAKNVRTEHIRTTVAASGGGGGGGGTSQARVEGNAHAGVMRLTPRTPDLNARPHSPAQPFSNMRAKDNDDGSDLDTEYDEVKLEKMQTLDGVASVDKGRDLEKGGMAV